MKKIFFLILFLTVPSWARLCTMEEIKQIDTRRQGVQYSPYPLMTKVTLASALLPLVPRLDSGSSESSTFWTVNFVGIGGWLYFGMKSIETPDCDDDRTGGRFYQPSLAEVVRFHHKEKELFWNTYSWNSLWMLGILITSQYPERQAAAALTLAIPWGFAFSKRWSAFTQDSEMDLGFRPVWDGQRWAFHPSVTWTF